MTAAQPIRPIAAVEQESAQPVWASGFRVYDGVYSLGLGLLLVYSAIPHLTNPYYFLGTVYSYELVGPKLGRFAAVFLPSLQIVLAYCLVLRRFLLGAHLLTLVLFVSFFAAHAYAALSGTSTYCGCFGPQNEIWHHRGAMLWMAFLVTCSILWVTGNRAVSSET